MSSLPVLTTSSNASFIIRDGWGTSFHGALNLFGSQVGITEALPSSVVSISTIFR